ncbi:T9SS type A sorting domain-containing protein [Candidatus Poribacteria bacterium]|nr:T9SS type A sorting domain-containing protein [Candidatus Poribacteria bacterium]
MSFVLTNGILTAPVTTNTYTPKLENGAITVVASPNWEVNKDYAVDTQDIVILGINFDKNIQGVPRPNPDVTRDKLVDIFDLVAVASHFGDEYSAEPKPLAAPAVVVKRAFQSLPAPTPVQHAVLVELYERVSGYPEADASVLAAKQLLARLIGASEPALPEETRVSQNYPNPFNPETWIPFALKEAAGVTIEIYNARGERVRTLALGQKPAGFYLTRDRAAYWDGRNVRGEPVASGVYFYSFTAGTYTATRKLIVLK